MDALDALAVIGEVGKLTDAEVMQLRRERNQLFAALLLTVKRLKGVSAGSGTEDIAEIALDAEMACRSVSDPS